MAMKTAMKTTTERHLFSTMSEGARQELVEELSRWGLTVWHTSAEGLRGYWLERKSDRTVLYVLRGPDGAVAGCATLKFYLLTYGGRDITVLKLGLGVTPAYRGNKFALRCLVSEFLRWKAAHPRRPMYLFSTLIHPVTYKLCCDVLQDRVYPYFKSPDNPAMQQMVEHLTELFGVERGDSPHPFVYKEQFSAIETDQALAYWRTSTRPEVRFFLEHCPEYDRSGNCLVGLAQLDVPHVVRHAVATLARNRVDKLRGRKASFA
jgi:hypothetical protein